MFVLFYSGETGESGTLESNSADARAVRRKTIERVRPLALVFSQYL
jgi:hypothetical protein